jgi:hypothetical protein
MKSIPISPTKGLVFVEVPEDAICKCYGKLPFYGYFSNGKTKMFDLPEGFKYTILGEVQRKLKEVFGFLGGTIKRPDIGFDPSPFLEVAYGGFAGTDKGFRDYAPEHFMMDESPLQADWSFVSLMKKNGIYLVNPMGKEPGHLKYKHRNQFNELVFTSEYSMNLYADTYEKWESFEKDTLKEGNKLLVILKEVI